MKLYEIADRYKNLEELVGNEGIPQNMVLSALAEVQEEFEVKADNLVRIIRNYEAECEAYKLEEKRLADKRKAAENKIQNLKDYLKSNMIILDKKKIKTSLFNLNIQNSQPSVELVNEELIPQEYIVVKKEVAKKPLLEALKQGIEVPGATIRQSQNLRIK